MKHPPIEGKFGTKLYYAPARHRYVAHEGKNLDAVYKSYSTAKRDAWSYCEAVAREFEAVDGVWVRSRNAMKFTAQFEFADQNGELCWGVIAPSGNFYFFESDEK